MSGVACAELSLRLCDLDEKLSAVFGFCDLHVAVAVQCEGIILSRLDVQKAM